MTNWKFDYNEVLLDDENRWWHVLERFESVDSDERRYRLADATHTEYKMLSADDVEGWEGYDGMFESAGWSTDTKPAAANGFRVNGTLCGPAEIQFWKDGRCIHEHTCPHCGEESKRGIDIIHSFEDCELNKTMLECRECGACWEEDND